MKKAKEYLSNRGYGSGTNYTTLLVASLMEEYRNQLPSGVPSDEEIRIESLVGYEDNTAGSLNFQLGAKWMRDRLAPMIAKLEEYKQKYGDL